jgi:hypothetical protein
MNSNSLENNALDSSTIVLVSRLKVLHDSLLSMERDTATLGLTWPQLLPKFNVIITQLTLVQQCIQKSMHNMIVMPNPSIEYDPEIDTGALKSLPLDVLLRTKLLPEQEAHESTLSDLRVICEEEPYARMSRTDLLKHIQQFFEEYIVPWNRSIQAMLDRLEEQVLEHETNTSATVGLAPKQTHPTTEMLSLDQLIQWQFI